MTGSRAAFIRVGFWSMVVMDHNLAHLSEIDNWSTSSVAAMMRLLVPIANNRQQCSRHSGDDLWRCLR